MLLFLFVVSVWSAVPWKEAWCSQPVDHFLKGPQLEWKQRYLLWDATYEAGGPLFIYTGNEGNIEAFWDNSGFVMEAATTFKALVVFAEHRYYGKSWPFGSESKSLERANIVFLSVEQALADFASLIAKVKSNYSVEGPVVAFGGSYGGMLSAWLRMKYPNICDIALASSAPVKMANGNLTYMGSPTYYETVTQTFTTYDDRCPVVTRQAFATVLNLIENGTQGLNVLTNSFSLCKPLTSDNSAQFIFWLQSTFGTLAILNYPYPTNFLAPLPAFPVKVACELLLNASSPLEGLVRISNFLYNGTKIPCFDIDEEVPVCANKVGCLTGAAGKAWDFQQCSGVNILPNTNNETDMFPPQTWSFSDIEAHCKTVWGVTPDPEWMKTYTGGADLSGASKIIFSNGLFDPWHGGGFLDKHTKDIVSVVIAEGAHHLDLRPSNARDPPSVTEARKVELALIKKWMEERNELEEEL